MTKASLQDVFDEMQARPDQWPASTYPKILDAFRRLPRLLNLTLAELPACSASLDSLMDRNLNWRTAGFSTQTAFRDFKGKIKRAIRDTKAGRSGIPTRTRASDFSPAWQALLRDVTKAVASGVIKQWIPCSIAQLANYANSLGREPCDIDSNLANELVRRQGEIGNRVGYQRAKASALTWNRLIAFKAKEDPDWLRHFPEKLIPLILVTPTTRINPAEETWPETLRAEVASLLAKRSSQDVAPTTGGPERFAILLSSRPAANSVEYGKRRSRRHRSGISPSTLRSSRLALSQAVGALVRAGKPLASITSLDDVLSLEAIATTLADLETRLYGNLAQSDRPSTQWHLAGALSLLAKLWRDVSTDERRLLADMRAACFTNSCGTMALNRKKLLWQFDDPANLLAWFNRPDELVKRAEAHRRRGRITTEDIGDIEVAILCRLISVLPVRRANLGTIRIFGDDRHLVLGRHSREPSWIVWPASEVKNKRALRAEIDKRTETLIRLYLDHYRPAFLKQMGIADSPALFPGRTTDRYGVGHRNISVLGRRFTDRMAEVGLKMTLHLGRHLAARIVLDVDPNLMPVVADLLGDSQATVREYYVDGQTARASAAYRKVLQDRALDLSLKWETQQAGEIGHD